MRFGRVWRRLASVPETASRRSSQSCIGEQRPRRCRGAQAIQAEASTSRAIRPPSVPPARRACAMSVNAGLCRIHARPVRRGACRPRCGESDVASAALFVTGTDTGVGKTVACAALMHRYRSLGSGLAPAEASCVLEAGSDRHRARTTTRREVRASGRLAARTRFYRTASAYERPRFAASGRPAERADYQRRRRFSMRLPRSRRPAAGSSRAQAASWSPQRDGRRWRDLIGRDSRCRSVVVARTALGTINHTLLTLEALAARSLAVAGVVMVGVTECRQPARDRNVWRT